MGGGWGDSARLLVGDALEIWSGSGVGGGIRDLAGFWGWAKVLEAMGWVEAWKLSEAPGWEGIGDLVGL